MLRIMHGPYCPWFLFLLFLFGLPSACTLSDTDTASIGPSTQTPPFEGPGFLAEPTSAPAIAPITTPADPPGEPPAAPPPAPTDVVTCTNFPCQQEAQAFFRAAGGPEEDPHGLDHNHDGIACEDLPPCPGSPPVPGLPMGAPCVRCPVGCLQSQCRICTAGRACGDSCIPTALTCQQFRSCACQG